MKKRLKCIMALMLCVCMASCSQNNEDDFAGMVTANSTNVAVLDQSGNVWTYGYNGNGGLGVGHEPHRASTPQKVMSGVSKVASGYQHNAVLKKDGSLWMWGSGAMGGMGKSNLKNTFEVPVKMLDSAKDIALSLNACLVLKKDGSVWGWGYVLGESSNSAASELLSNPHQIIDNAAEIYCSSMLFAVLKKDGSLWMWGNNNYGQMGNGNRGPDTVEAQKTSSVMEYQPVKVMDGVKSVCLEQDFVLAVKNDNSVWAWGNNECGQIGNGESGDGKTGTIDAVVTAPYRVTDDAKQIKTTYMTCYLIKNDNTLWGWGRNDNAEMGDGIKRTQLLTYAESKSMVKSPTKIMDEVADVFPAARKCFAGKTDGSFWGWGSNLYSATGTGLKYTADDNKTFIVSAPTQITALTDVKALAFSKGVKMILIMQGDGKVFSWGEDIYYKAGPVFLKTDLPEEVAAQVKAGSGLEFLVEYQKKVVAENTFPSPVAIAFS